MVRFHPEINSDCAGSGLARCSRLVIRTVLVLICIFVGFEAAAGAQIVKVLPHLLDAKGRNSLAPSLYERDAYQDYLRKHPDLRSAIQFDVFWKGKRVGRGPLRLRLEVRTGRNHFVEPLVLESAVKPPGWFGRWSRFKIQGQEFKELGEIVAWRATLWTDNQLLAEHRSFLW